MEILSFLIFILIVIGFIALITSAGAEEKKKSEKRAFNKAIEEKKKNEAKLIIQKEVAEIFKNVCKEVIYKHRFTLLANRKKLLTKDSYGRIKDKGWDSIENIKNWGPNSKDPAIQFFIDDVMRTEINDHHRINYLFNKFPKDDDDEFYDKYDWAILCYSKTFSSGPQWITDQINSVCDDLENKNVKFGDSSSMDGVQYEQFCKRILKDAGWVVEDTPTTGDQGVDLIASIEDLRVCIQCKCFAKPVGNKAVQEVAAGMIHWNGTHSVVVGKSGFTKSAKALAASTNVILTSDIELENLENLVL